MTNPEISVANAPAALSGSFPGDLGIELLEIKDEFVRGRPQVDRRHLHPGGYVHGGVWVAFADTIAAWGTMRNLAPDENFTTVELKVHPDVALEAVSEPPGHVWRRRIGAWPRPRTSDSAAIPSVLRPCRAWSSARQPRTRSPETTLS